MKVKNDHRSKKKPQFKNELFHILHISVDYVAKNWALAMMLKALPLVHFWSVLLLKEQMMTSVRKTLISAKPIDF